MEKKDFVGTISQVLATEVPKRIHTKYPYMNYGGCAKFALRLIDALRAVGLDATAQLVGNSQVDKSDPEWPANCRVDHIVVVFNGRQWDSEGENNDRPTTDGEIPYNDLVYLISNKYWNPSFEINHGDAIWGDVVSELSAAVRIGG